MWKKKIMNPFDSYMLNKVRRLKDVRTRYAAMGDDCECKPVWDGWN